jgi:hypothetical protein
VAENMDVCNTEDVLEAITGAREQVRSGINQRIAECLGVKWFITVVVTLYKYDRDNEKITYSPAFRGSVESLLTIDDFDSQFNEQVDLIMRRFNEFLSMGSGWILDSVDNIVLSTAAYQPIGASSYIQLPEYVARKRAVINVKNENDEKCFLWSVLASLHEPKSNKDRITHYLQYEGELNVQGLSFPVTVPAGVKKFEQLNPSISINVFAVDGKSGVYPIFATSHRDRQHHVNLLMLTEGVRRHYTWIRDMSMLLRQPGDNCAKKSYCNYCMHGFWNQQAYDNHIEFCRLNGIQKVIMPDDTCDTVEFKSMQKMLKAPFVIYADLESYTTKLYGPLNKDARTHNYELHEPSGFAYKVVCSESSIHSFEPVVYRGENVIQELLTRLREEYDRIHAILKDVKPMKLTEEEKASFKAAQVCYLCRKPVDTLEKVRDHCHITGRYRGCAHQNCNLQYQFSADKRNDAFYVPVIFHNLRGYDGKIILKQYRKEAKGFCEKLSAIPNSSEKFLSFSIGSLRFIDSLQFMNASLEKLASNLQPGDFVHTRHHFPAEKVGLVLRKGVFPYEYWDSPARGEETQLPPPSAFHSRLTGEDVSASDYAHGQRVWYEFGLKTLGQYHDLYLKTDVLILADVFEKFRDMCMRHYGLDAAHYYSLPGFAWDAMLKMTGVQLELMKDREMHDVIDKGTRGGISCVSHKYAAANNPLVPETYDSSQPNSYITFLDMNNLYGTAMVEPLPESGFAWLPEDEASSFDFATVPDDASTGYILEVDLDYPDHIHNLHSDYPLAPESAVIDPTDLSPYTQSLAEKLGISSTGGCRKLVATLKPKRRYAVHYRNLKLYVQLGMVVTKIHRVISFKQSRWLKTYIDFNTEMRRLASNAFEKDFFKLMNNAVFGKTMENVRKHMNLKLVNERAKFRRMVSKPCFKSFNIISEDLVAVSMAKKEVKLIKPTYVGMTILDLSKMFMYEFHYNKMMVKYGGSERAKLLLTDTDSLVYLVQTPDVYRDMMDDLASYDTSDYPRDHPAYSSVNAKRLGCMKDEYNSKPIAQFVGLRPKMYSILGADGAEKKRAKGVPTRTTARMRHQTYVDVLTGEKTTTVEAIRIASSSLQVYTTATNKKALSPYDDKRYVLADRVTTLAFGHCSIPPSPTPPPGP